MRTKIVLILFVCLLAIGCAGGRNRPGTTVPMAPTQVVTNEVVSEQTTDDMYYLGLSPVHHPDCSDPVWVNPYHAGLTTRGSWQSAALFNVTNPSEGVNVNIRIISESPRRTLKLRKHEPKVTAGGVQTIVANLCPGASLSLFERRLGSRSVQVFFVATGRIGFTTYTDRSPSAFLNASYGYGGWQRNEGRNWVINLRQTPLASPPRRYYDRSGRTYSDQGVIRVR
ncbi:MAG: hypothetical protein COV34_03460 [Candidatus Zambryskibacteria bacterium CG10_big_fil_rev_8_21_14_0_10_42_12]|uniref:Uncharacterized protein n=1 Tax=Candidatus Zambryskibacteria bacterium CG10_big_fil_rev_8_21_14_0_10_42_12 TaxID=1975115 RepID=A0A2H0QSJ4_9BACT|nr:MAG: hypothetical protein COV34_03460 [Candidatus Zambryskibacteria bacterium CG10_big_fil_rev_8_21_14_0_10_42_12]